ncbi:hypothetical protein M9Y10_006352 [Tritrichomonas musculus]|uniref:F5/8 type C domain-containing protein n=1 Tax=Tritrichomonas musculus TaxID=1915356 RepID=A0ABR2JDY7_9EUKA
MSAKIQLQTSSILHVPFINYLQDFTFIINNKKYQTSRFIADLLSQKIAQLHQIDPTITEFTINTQTDGNFNDILNLITFETKEFESKDILFFSEIFNKLDISTEYIKININEQNSQESSIISNLLRYQQLSPIYDEKISQEIQQVSTEFYKLYEREKEELKKLNKNIIEDIISSPSLQLETEDQLIDLINNMYKIDQSYCDLYKYVEFKNVSSDKMIEFCHIILLDDITSETWKSLSERLSTDVKHCDDKSRRYRPKRTVFKEINFNNQEFDGLINYLRKKTNIEEEISVTYSSLSRGDPMTVFRYEEKGNWLYTRDSKNSWFCFEFKKHEIIPTNYTIRTINNKNNTSHLKSWVIEGSKDNNKWTTLDEENDSPYLYGSYFSHTFSIQNETQESFRFIRIRQTGPNWINGHTLLLNHVEFYGLLI